MFKIIKKTLLVICLLSLVAKAVFATAIFLYPIIITEDSDINVSSIQLINTTNEYRQTLDLDTLKPNPRLTQAAVNKAYDLLTNQYFEHTSPDGKKFSQWIKDVNYNYFYVGENLAIDFDSNETIFQAWLDSPTHRENIIKPQYQEIGVAVVEGKYKNRQTVVVVQLFGSRVMGNGEPTSDEYEPLEDFTSNYFLEKNFLQKIISLNRLEKLNEWNNYLLIISMGLYLATYTPRKRRRNIKQPIINRYQAKIFRE
jgi:uncharacterized protein YkwD